MNHSPVHFAAVLTVAGVLTGTTACVAELPEIGDTKRASVCPLDECGGNSATVGQLYIGEVHIAGTSNSGDVNNWGAQLIDFKTPNQEDGYSIAVRRGAFVARNGASTMTGADLVGSEFRFSDDDGAISAVHILDVDTVPSWTDTTYPVERYKIALHKLSDDSYTPICEDAVDIDDDAAWAVLVSRERYDWSGKSVVATGQAAAGWFNIACEGNALYKNKLMGQDPRPPLSSPYVTRADERQASLKMLTADYCGTGTSFTETGWALLWENRGSWAQNHAGGSLIHEARWDASGATCLDAPRLGLETMADILAECQSTGKVLQPCGNQPNGNADWVSYNPDL